MKQFYRKTKDGKVISYDINCSMEEFDKAVNIANNRVDKGWYNYRARRGIKQPDGSMTETMTLYIN